MLSYSVHKSHHVSTSFRQTVSHLSNLMKPYKLHPLNTASGFKETQKNDNTFYEKTFLFKCSRWPLQVSIIWLPGFFSLYSEKFRILAKIEKSVSLDPSHATVCEVEFVLLNCCLFYTQLWYFSLLALSVFLKQITAL